MSIYTQAFAVGQVTIKDPQCWQQYKDALDTTLLKYQGKVSYRGKVSEVLAGNKSHTDVVFIEFDSIEALNTWFYSQEYQEIIPLRDRAASVTLTSYQA